MTTQTPPPAGRARGRRAGAEGRPPRPALVAADRQGHPRRRSCSRCSSAPSSSRSATRRSSSRCSTSSPTRGTSSPARGDAIWSSYSALVNGSVGSGNAIGTTLERAAPLICAGLGVTLAFRAGLFNIGAQGQLIVGAICRRLRRLHLGPAARHPPARRPGRGADRRRGLGRHRRPPQGAHRRPRGDHARSCSTTSRRRSCSTRSAKEAFQRPGSDNPLSPPVDDSATFPELFGSFAHRRARSRSSPPSSVWWLLERSTFGFELRAVGANPHAAAHRRHERGEGLHAGDGRSPACWPAWPPPCTCSATQRLAQLRRRRQRSASTRSPSRCSGGPRRSARCSPGCCSAR